MDNKAQPSTAERAPVRGVDEIVLEAKRIEEDLQLSSKGHWAMASFWSNFHLWVGIPMVLCAAAAGAAALSKFDPSGLFSGVLSLIVVCLSSLMTFLNPNDKASAHLRAGNYYDGLMNTVRIFWSIECWRIDNDELLTSRLKEYSEEKRKLNLSCPQISRWAYRVARNGIADGEGQHAVDKVSPDR